MTKKFNSIEINEIDVIGLRFLQQNEDKIVDKSSFGSGTYCPPIVTV